MDALNGLNFPVLVRFLVLANELHFTRAAEQLGIAQPLLSEQIKSLEHTLEVRLFRRTSRKVELTDAGHAFRERVQLIVQGMEDSIQDTRAVQQGEQSRLRIGYTDEFAHELLPAAMGQLMRNRPLCNVELTAALTPVLAERIRAGLIDVAFVCPIPDESFGPRYGFAQLPPLPLAVAVPSHHPLAGAGEVALTDLKDQAFIEGPILSASEQVFNRLFSRLGLERRIVERVPDAEMAMSLVQQGLGIMIGYFSENMRQRKGIATLPLTDPHAQLTRAVVWRKLYSPALLEAFLAITMELSRKSD